MKRAVIFANGRLQNPEQARHALRPEDILIAADGGALHCLALGLTPSVVIGDFDSMEEQEVESLKSRGVRLIRHPAHKDFTDLELALQHAQKIGVQEILILGALGARWDQTIANLLLPASADLARIQISMLDGPQEVYFLHPEHDYRIRGKTGDTLSLIPICGDVHGIVTQGLEYPLHGETLYFAATRGISNLLIEDTAHIRLEKGSLLCVHIHQQAEHAVG